MLNLIRDRWIPVRTQAGPQVIRPDQIAEPGISFPDWPRADLNLACLELLIGLVYLAAPPADEEEWLDGFATPPPLDAAMAPLAPAFDLLGSGPRFLQEDLCPVQPRSNQPPESSPPDMLFIDSAGGSTARKNADLMVRRARYPELPLPLAAMALFTLQAHAPSGGAGNRTSMRGGGPMVTLVRPKAEGEAPLWSLIWANVPEGRAIEDLSALPWMRPVRTSEKGQIAVPPRDDTRPVPETFFGMPRRLRLVSDERGGGPVVTGVIQKPWGTNYEGWIHPLTPYYATTEGKLPRHPKAGAFGYRNWRGVVFEIDGADRARTLDRFLEDREDTAMRLIVAGWAMNNMSPIDFLWSEQPVLSLSREAEFRAAGMVEAAEQAGFALASAVRDGTHEDLGSGAALRAREVLFARTQGPFEGVMARLVRGEDRTVEEDWLRDLRKEALHLFDEEVLPGLPDLHETRRAKAVVAWRVLRAALSGRTKTGVAMYHALDLELPPKPKRKEMA